MQFSSELDLALFTASGEDLHDVMADAASQGPALRATFLGRPALLLTGFATLREFFARHEDFPGGEIYQFATKPHIGSTFIDMDGAEHDRYRQLAMPAFRSRAVAQFIDSDLVPLAHEVVDSMLRRAHNSDRPHHVDLATDFAQVLPFWAISRKLGLPVGTEERQRAWALALLSYPTHPAEALAAAKEVTEFLRPTLAERRAHPANDVISTMLLAERDGVRLDDEQVSAHVRLLYAVGATTTSDALSTLLHRIIAQPSLAERLRTEPEYTDRVIGESLRTEPPVSVLPRLATSGGHLAEVDLPAGTLVLCGIAGANRDPQHFIEPNRFNPDRSEGEVMTFGFGQKYCPGTHLARQQLKAAVTVLLQRLTEVRPVDCRPPAGAVLRKTNRLVVEFSPAE